MSSVFRVLGVGFILCCVARPAAGQVFSLGVKGGAGITSIGNVGQLTNQSDDSARRDSGLILGAFAGVDNTHGLDFQAELLFVEKNVSVESPVGDATRVRIRYLELPLFAKISRPFTGGNRRLYGMLGPSVSYRINAALFRGNDLEDLTEDVPRFDLAGAVAVGLEMGRVHVEGRFTQGFLNVSTDNDLYARSRSYAILAGFRF